MEFSQQPSQSNRFSGQLPPRYLRSRRSRVALVKHEIDDLQHCVHPPGQLPRRRHLVGNPRLSNLCLGAHNALGQRRRRNQKRPRNLFRCQAAYFAQRERNLSFRGQSRMTARENQTQAIILNLFLFHRSVAHARFHMGNEVGLRSVESRPPADRVDGLEACR